MYVLISFTTLFRYIFALRSIYFTFFRVYDTFEISSNVNLLQVKFSLYRSLYNFFVILFKLRVLDYDIVKYLFEIYFFKKNNYTRLFKKKRKS